MLFLKEINFSLKFIFCTPFCFYSGLIITKSRSNILPIRVGNLSTANNICSKEYTSVKISLAAYCHNKNWGIVGWYLSILVCYFMAHEHLLKAHIYLHTASGDTPCSGISPLGLRQVLFAKKGSCKIRI